MQLRARKWWSSVENGAAALIAVGCLRALARRRPHPTADVLTRSLSVLSPSHKPCYGHLLRLLRAAKHLQAL